MLSLILLLLSFHSLVLCTHDSFDVRDSIIPLKIGNSDFYFCMNYDRIPAFNSRANISVTFYFNENSSIDESFYVSWFSIEELDLQFSLTSTKLKMFLLTNDKSFNNWDMSLLLNGTFNGFIRTNAILDSISIEMHANTWNDIAISQYCVQEAYVVSEQFPFVTYASLDEQDDYYYSKSTTVDSFSAIEVKRVYALVIVIFGVSLGVYFILCTFCIIFRQKVYKDDVNWIDEPIEIPTIISTPRILDDYPDFPEKEQNINFFGSSSPNPFDKILINERVNDDVFVSATNLQSDSESSFGSLEPEELSTPLRYIFALRIKDLISLMLRR